MSSLYRVTDTAPPRVNGLRVKPGETLMLSEAEALYERDLGHVEAATPEAEPADQTGAESGEAPALDAAGDAPHDAG